jgi:hypothetical protein
MAALQSTLRQWFSILVRQRMPAAALGVAGMAVGYAVAVSSVPLPQAISSSVAMVGVALMWGSLALFLANGVKVLLVQPPRASRARR